MSTQPWHRRQEIPDPQIRDAANQFESARQLLWCLAQWRPGSGLLYPLMNTASVAIELYLKCLSAEKVYTEAEGGWSKVSAKPQRGHGLTMLLDEVEGGLGTELDRAFLGDHSAFGCLSFRTALEQCEGTFERSRYPFETAGRHNLSQCPLDLLMACSHFLQQFVARLDTTETIQWK